MRVYIYIYIYTHIAGYNILIHTYSIYIYICTQIYVDFNSRDIDPQGKEPGLQLNNASLRPATTLKPAHPKPGARAPKILESPIPGLRFYGFGFRVSGLSGS